MTTATASSARPAAASRATPGRTSRRRRALGLIVVLVGLILVWEGAKWLGGDPWRIHGTVAGITIDYEHRPPLSWRIADDLSLPHVWDVARAFVDPAQRGGPTARARPLRVVRCSPSGRLSTGFVFGGLLGLLLGILFVHSRLAERALVPYVVASQAVPILAISPIIVVATKAGWISVAIISTYLTFFPVTIAALRGLRAADPRAFELFRSYASSSRQVLWKLRLPSAVPYLFASLRIAAAASVIGAIIGELPSGIPDGLGSAILNYNQYYVAAPERLWATIVACSAVGLVFVGLVRLAESVITRGNYRSLEAT